eukprot:3642732-Rhodomonas_salina.1
MPYSSCLRAASLAISVVTHARGPVSRLPLGTGQLEGWRGGCAAVRGRRETRAITLCSLSFSLFEANLDSQHGTDRGDVSAALQVLALIAQHGRRRSHVHCLLRHKADVVYDHPDGRVRGVDPVVLARPVTGESVNPFRALAEELLVEAT